MRRCENCNGVRNVVQFPTPEEADEADGEHFFAHGTLDGCLDEAKRAGMAEALRWIKSIDRCPPTGNPYPLIKIRREEIDAKLAELEESGC